MPSAASPSSYGGGVGRRTLFTRKPHQHAFAPRTRALRVSDPSTPSDAKGMPSSAAFTVTITQPVLLLQSPKTLYRTPFKARSAE